MNIGMNAALSGLFAAQRAIDVASHNLANAGTEGYSRQRADSSATTPWPAVGLHSGGAGVGQIGTGVQIDQVLRITDQFLNRQVRTESTPLGEQKVAADTLSQLEDIFAEPSDQALSTVMDNFWDRWQELVNNPEKEENRRDLREVATTMASVFNDLHDKMVALKGDVNGQIQTTVQDINSQLKQVAQLNGQIQTVIAAGQNPNDLQDQRDLLLEKLSENLGINVITTSKGSMNVYVGGNPLVSEDHVYEINALSTGPLGAFELSYGPNQTAFTPTGGKLKGLMDARDITLSDTDPRGYMTQLNSLANGMATQLNTLHKSGYALDGSTGLAFFQEYPGPPAVAIDASNIAVNSALMDDTTNPPGYNLIAAAKNDPTSATGGIADNGMALSIAQLRNKKLMSGGQATFEDFYKGTLVTLGSQTQDAQRRVSTQELLIGSVKERRDSVSGVSSDEEMANVIKFQKAYQASARMMSTIDEMLDTLINIGR